MKGAAGDDARARRYFDDYLARLALSQQPRGAWGEGVDARPPEGELRELILNGSVHESLVEEPRAA